MVTYTLSNKNPSAWNFQSPEPEVTFGTVAIIIRAVLLSPYLRNCCVSLPSVHYNQSHRVYINRRQQSSSSSSPPPPPPSRWTSFSGGNFGHLSISLDPGRRLSSVCNLHLANILFDIILPSVLGSSLWSFGLGFPFKYLLNCYGIWHSSENNTFA